VSPRGVAIPEVRQQLFQAAERVLHRDGPDGLTSRAITDEAGVAKGLLYNHFKDLDQFLAELIVDRARAAADETATLLTMAGTGTVAGNLTEAATTLLRSQALTIVGIVHSRPALMERLHQAGASRPFSVFDDVEQAFATYLKAEQQAGRISAQTDTETLALVLVGTIHHLFMTGRANLSSMETQIQQIMASLTQE